MPPEPLVRVRVTKVGTGSRPAWAEGLSFRLPASVVASAGLAPYLNTAGDLTVPREPGPVRPGFAQELRLRAAFTDRRPLSARLPFSYQWIPAAIRSLIAAGMGMRKRRSVDRWAVFPGWPLDLSSDFLADLTGEAPSPFAMGPTPVVLSHDLDSAEGLTNLVRWFLPLEEAVGVRSTNYVVPCAWKLDHGLLTAVSDRGHDLGIHGYDHSNRTAFAEERARRHRLYAARELLDRYRMTGYRAPSLLRTPALLRDLSALYVYDSSIPTSGGAFPVPNNGCASARPFLVQGIPELPLSMPRDGSLRFLRYRPAEILQLWIQCAETIARSGGVVVLLTHCEARFSGNSAMLAAYREFLDFVASSSHYRWSTPEEVLRRAGLWRLPTERKAA